MSSVILSGDGKCLLQVSNARMSTLVEFALEVATSRGDGSPELARLREFWEKSFPGINFDLPTLFPSLQERKYWATVFFDVARRIFLRQLGSQEISFWQTSAITDACIIARELARLVVQVHPNWRIDSEDAAESVQYRPPHSH